MTPFDYIIVATCFVTEHDCASALGVLRGVRRLFVPEPLASRVEIETVPRSAMQTDAEIIDAGLRLGACGCHAIGTCATGPKGDDVVDAQPRVRGVAGSGVDASVLPIMVSGNLDEPVSAQGCRAAEFILDGRLNDPDVSARWGGEDGLS